MLWLQAASFQGGGRSSDREGGEANEIVCVRYGIEFVQVRGMKFATHILHYRLYVS